ncbi:hypothetical protein JCM8202v2_001858 [Rhodotorula sphaerocarpa]
MAKSSNPVDAHRKAQRKQELKRNKQKREHTREISTVKKDTRPIEAEIRRLSQQASKGPPLSKDDRDELAHLKNELARINKAKHECKSLDAARDVDEQDSTSGLYDKNGRLKHPERSLYYDPVFNPYGAPPPGMPYREKPEFAMARMGPTPEEIAAFQPVDAAAEESEEDEDEDEDDGEDIAMPEGPPPGSAAPAADASKPTGAEQDDSSDSASDDDDDIPLPPGPPPPRAGSASATPPPGTARHTVAISRPSSGGGGAHQPLPPPPHSLPSRPNFRQPGAPPHGPKNPRFPARPPPPGSHMSDPLNTEGGPNRAYQQGRSIGPMQPAGGPGYPPPPPAAAGPSPFFAIPGAQPSIVAGAAAAAAPGAPPSAGAAGPASSATISAAPQLRDLRKEATAFVPLAMRKKMKQQQATLSRAGLVSINAARGADPVAGVEGDGDEDLSGEAAAAPKKRTLMDEMRERGIGAAAAGMSTDSNSSASRAASAQADGGADDYERFREEMADLL